MKSESLKNMLTKMSSLEVFLDIKEIRKPEVEAKLVAENIATQLEKRISFRRAMKKAIQSSMRLGAKGVKIVCNVTVGVGIVVINDILDNTKVVGNPSKTI